MPFLVAEILNFQGSAHHVGVGSLSKKLIRAGSKPFVIRHRALQDLKIRPAEFENLPMWERVMITASIVVEHNLDGGNKEVGS